MHSAIVAHQSPVLGALVNGKFREAIERSVNWKDVDERTFRSFWKYAYSGNYDIPVDLLVEPEIAAITSKLREPDPRLEDDELWYLRGGTGKRRKSAQHYNIWDDFPTSWKVDMTIHDNGCPHDRRAPKDVPELFIHHAKVYMVADRYNMARLIDLAFQELHNALMRYSISHKAVDVMGIVKVLEFCCTGIVPDRLKQWHTTLRATSRPYGRARTFRTSWKKTVVYLGP